MKFQVTLKDPDGFSDGLHEAAERSIAPYRGALDEAEQGTLIEQRVDKLAEFWAQWVEDGEYVTLEFDTETKTAVVVPRKATP